MSTNQKVKIKLKSLYYLSLLNWNEKDVIDIELKALLIDKYLSGYSIFDLTKKEILEIDEMVNGKEEKDFWDVDTIVHREYKQNKMEF